MAQQIKANIELENGKKLTHYQSLIIKQDLFGHHEFKLKVPFEILENKDENFFNKSHKDVCGKALTVSFEQVLKKGSFDFQFKGIVSEIAISNQSDLSNSFVIKGCSPTMVLEDCTMRRTFLNKTVQQIFDSILSAYPGNVIKKKLNPRHKNPIKYCVQYDESNFQFLNRIASEYGEWFYYNGKEIILGDHGFGKEVDFLINGIQSYDMSITLMPAKFKMKAYDYTKNQSYEGKSLDQSVEGLSQFGKFALDESEDLFSQEALLVSKNPVYNQNELDELIKFRRSCIASNMIVFHGRGENPDISVGSVINVSGIRSQKGGKTSKESFGKYRITEITHSLDNSSNYSNSFKAVPETVKFPPVNPHVHHPLGQPELATVTDNNDPDKLSRVKVEFNWSGQDKESDWIRVGNFYAGGGDGIGMQFIPEKESQVVVGYELNRPENPFVVTSLYPKKDGMRSMKGSNDEKVIYTKAGNTIELTDKRGENKIQITNTNNPDTAFVLEFKNNGLITLKTNGKIQIEAQESITLSAKQKISMEAPEIEIKAQQKATISGTEIKMEADANAEISANGTAKLSASGPLTLQGALVKIN